MDEKGMWRREWHETGLNPDRGAPDAKDALIAELVQALEKAKTSIHEAEAELMTEIDAAIEKARKAGSVEAIESDAEQARRERKGGA